MYKCDVCDKVFNHSSRCSLKVNRRIHTGDIYNIRLVLVFIVNLLFTIVVNCTIVLLLKCTFVPTITKSLGFITSYKIQTSKKRQPETSHFILNKLTFLSDPPGGPRGQTS